VSQFYVVTAVLHATRAGPSRCAARLAPPLCADWIAKFIFKTTIFFLLFPLWPVLIPYMLLKAII
jgi:hypothetical protein